MERVGPGRLRAGPSNRLRVGGLILSVVLALLALVPTRLWAADVRLELPVRTWVARPLPPIGQGGAPTGAKHARWLFDARRTRMVLTGGDWSPMAELATDPYFYDGQNTTWALDVATGRWEELSPYCRPAGEVQPARPDNVIWVYDSRRDRYIIMPGYYFGRAKALQACPNRATPVHGALLLNPEARAWEMPPFPPPREGYGGDMHSSFGVYDPGTDVVLRVRMRSAGPFMEILRLAKNSWDEVPLGGDRRIEDATALHREQAAIDVEGRSVYAIARGREPFLLRYDIKRERVRREAPMPAGFVSSGSTQESLLVFDPINRVLLAPNIPNYGGEVLRLFIYHVDTRKWEVEEIPNRGVVDGHPVMGCVLGFDPANSAMVLIGGHALRDDDTNKPSPSRLDPSRGMEDPKVYWLYRYGNGPSKP